MYWVSYKLKGDMHVFWTQHGPRQFEEGFWVDRDYTYTQGSSAYYFIPWHMVQHITKENHVDSL